MKPLYQILYAIFTEIHVGFERIFTPVTEDIGSLELCVEIFTDAFLLPANFDFSLNLVTISGTAGRPVDVS